MTLLKGRTFIVLVLLVIFFTIVKGTTFLSASTLTMVAKHVALYGILALWYDLRNPLPAVLTFPLVL